jgi:uncharacterized membrane protein YhaH (DUF805 family)
MFCQQCGTQIEEGMNFCTTCGAKLASPEATVVANVVENIPEQPVVEPVVENIPEQPVQPIQPEQPVQQAAPIYQPINRQEYAPQYSFEQPSTYEETTSSGSPKKVSFGGAIKLYFVNYVNFSGRSTRSEYWWIVLFTAIVSVCTSWIPVVGYIVTLGLIIPNLSLGIRRLHDGGKSWAYIFMGLIPIVGAILLIIQYCKESDADNKWGPAAK